MNGYLLKIEAKSFRDESQNLCKDTESNLGPLDGVYGWNYPEASFILASVMNSARRIILSNYTVCSVFSFVLFSNPPRPFFSSKSRKKCSHSRFSFQAITVRFLARNVGLFCLCFSVAMGGHGYLRWVKQLMRGEKKILINSGFLLFCWNFNVIKLDC